jgi:transposase
MPKKWKFTDAQKLELNKLARTHPTPYLRMRALALVHLSAGKSAQEAADAVLAHRVSVGVWARAFLDSGLKGLEIKDGRGRQEGVIADELESYLRQSPQAFGLTLARWSLSALAMTVPSLKGMSPAGVKKALERHGFAYKRGQPHLHSPDPEYEVKKGRWMPR